VFGPRQGGHTFPDVTRKGVDLMLPITDMAREAALAIAVLVAGVYPSGTVDGAPPGRGESPVCAVAARPADQAHCPRGGDTSVAANNDTARASVTRRGSDSSEPEPQSSGSTANCDSGRKEPSGGAGGGAQSSDDGATDGDDDAAGQVGSAQSSAGEAGRGGQNPERTSSDSESTDSESTDSESTDSENPDSENPDSKKPDSKSTDSDSSNSEHGESGKSGGEDSSKSDGEESGSGESEYEPSSDGDSDDQATDRSDEESEDEEAVQTRNETGGRTQLVGQERAVQYPADLINTDQWYLTLPTGVPGSPDTVEGEQLKTFSNDFFRLTPDRKGIVFAANAGGVTTENSNYPRSELREMNGSEKAAWSNTSGTHILDVCEAVTKVPDGKPEVVAAQIHDGSDDVMQIRLEDRTLMVQYDDGAKDVVLDEAYQLGTPYQLRIVAADSQVTVAFNGQQKAELPLSGSGWYWKVGAYVQANEGQSDPEALGEVIVYSSQITHNDDGGGDGNSGEGDGAAGAASSATAEQKDRDERADNDLGTQMGSKQDAEAETSHEW
jgi:Alginate lyase